MNLVKLFKKSRLILDSHQLCVLQVRKYDRENYLAGLCISDNRIKRLTFALRAFNVELAIIRDKTTDSDRAKARFHFWSKLIDEIIRRNDKNNSDLSQDKLHAYYNHTPVAKELFELFYEVNIDESSEKYLKDLIGSRLSSKVLGYKAFEDMDELLLYCSKSNESLYQLSWRVASQLHRVQIVDDLFDEISLVAHHLGIAHGLSNVIRAIPYNASKGACFIPADILHHHGLVTSDLRLSMKRNQLDGGKLIPLVNDLADICQSHVNYAHEKNRNVPSLLRQIFLPRLIVQNHLDRLRKCNYDICDARLRQQNGLLPLKLWLNCKYDMFS